MEDAFAQLHARPDACNGFSMAGMTDRLIARLGLEAIGVAVDDGSIQAILKTYLQALGPGLQASDAVRALPGAQRILQHLQQIQGLALGLGTGNLQDGAMLKLARVGLAAPFTFGGYGSDSEDRRDLVRIGAIRGAERLGHALEQTHVYVVGDTPRDMQAAHSLRRHAAAAFAIGVATGPYPIEVLQQAGADQVLADLTDLAWCAGWLAGA